jgi:hypothetical protein
MNCMGDITKTIVSLLSCFRHGVTPFTPLKGLFIQGSIFMSVFFAVSLHHFVTSKVLISNFIVTELYCIM